MATILVDENHYKHLRNIANLTMVSAFEEYSDDHYSAGWMHDIEHIIWEETKRKVDANHITDRDADLFHILMLSNVLNGWVSLDSAGEAIVVDLDQWHEIHAKYLADRN